MTSSHKPADTFLTSLTVCNVQSLPDGSSANERLRQFVVSQSRYSKDRASEGMAFRESWDTSLLQVNKTTPPPHPQHVWVSGFDTPILKPRVPASDLVAKPSFAVVPPHRLSTSVSSISRLVSPKGSPPMKKRKRSRTPSGPRVPTKSKRKVVEGNPKPKKRAGKDIDANKPRTSSKRRRSPAASDEEHVQSKAFYILIFPCITYRNFYI
ncbi:hypothetical protein OF83DRAFT_132983 [Amylostereum chailletii]|nr:hypothetical protein OF83DRAFT_132983 [Amylostereum chailletii]